VSTTAESQLSRVVDTRGAVGAQKPILESFGDQDLWQLARAMRASNLDRGEAAGLLGPHRLPVPAGWYGRINNGLGVLLTSFGLAPRDAVTSRRAAAGREGHLGTRSCGLPIEASSTWWRWPASRNRVTPKTNRAPQNTMSRANDATDAAIVIAGHPSDSDGTPHTAKPRSANAATAAAISATPTGRLADPETSHDPHNLNSSTSGARNSRWTRP
jgi:hypothetical protein